MEKTTKQRIKNIIAFSAFLPVFMWLFPMKAILKASADASSWQVGIILFLVFMADIVVTMGIIVKILEEIRDLIDPPKERP